MKARAFVAALVWLVGIGLIIALCFWPWGAFLFVLGAIATGFALYLLGMLVGETLDYIRGGQ